MSTSTIIEGSLHFKPKELPSDSGRDGLVIAQILSIDKDEQKIEILNILNPPKDLTPGFYTFVCEARGKKDKSGISYWFKSCQPSKSGG